MLLFIEGRKTRSESLVQVPGVRKNFLAIESFIRTIKVMTRKIVTLLSTNYVKTKFTYTLFLFYSA